MKYMVRNLDSPNNTYVYSIHSDLDSFILYNENDINEKVNENEGELSPRNNQTSPLIKKMTPKTLATPKYKTVTNLKLTPLAYEF